MRKKKKKYANVIMLLLILFVLFYVVLQDKSIKISTEEILRRYSLDITVADKTFLNKEIILKGKVKSFVQLEGVRSLLQLDSGNNRLQLYCILMNKETEEKAAKLTAEAPVTVYGKCLGMNPPSMNKFPHTIYIQTELIK